MNDDDLLDELLDASAPRVTAPTATIREELTRMAVSAGTERRPLGRGARLAVGAGFAAVVLFGGVGTAAASGVIDWGPWAQDPDVVYEYTLPSGEPCELRVTFDNRQTGAIARQLIAGVDLARVIDVDGEIRSMRTAPSVGGDEFGNTFDTGYGTKWYPGPDEEYDRAVQSAVDGYVSGLLGTSAAVGIDPELGAVSASTCSIEFANER